jgi:hypothetical protein
MPRYAQEYVLETARAIIDTNTFIFHIKPNGTSDYWIHRLNLEPLNLEWLNLERLNPEWTEPQMDPTPNGLNPKWTEPRMDWTQNGLNSELTQPRRYSTPTGTQPQLDWTQNGTQPRISINLKWNDFMVYIKRMDLKREYNNIF